MLSQLHREVKCEKLCRLSFDCYVLGMPAVELAPLAAQNEIALQTYTKVPLSFVPSL